VNCANEEIKGDAYITIFSMASAVGLGAVGALSAGIPIGKDIASQ